jgi:hypothetical protein
VSPTRAKKKRRRRARAAMTAGEDGTAREAGAGREGGAPGAGAAAAAAGSRRTDGRAAQRAATPAPATARPSRFEVRDGVARPRPIWAPFPLTEIGMAAGLAIFVAGMLSGGHRARWLLSVAVAMLVVVVGELCVREHLAGFRSHTLLLAVLPVAILNGLAVVVAGDGWAGPPVLLADLALAGALAWWLQTRYRLARERARAAASGRQGG